jgi:hypothetical protein
MLLYFHKGQNDMYKHFVFASLRIYIPGIMKSVCIEGFDFGSKTLSSGLVTIYICLVFIYVCIFIHT